MTKRYKATFKTKFSFGFDALNRQNAQVQVDQIKVNLGKEFEKEYGKGNYAINAKLEELAF